MQVCGECICRRVGQMLNGGREREESQVKRWGARRAQINVCSTWNRLWKQSHAERDGVRLRDLHLWLDKPHLCRYFLSLRWRMQFNTRCPNPGQRSLITIYCRPRLGLPGLRHERSAHFTHNNLISQPLAWGQSWGQAPSALEAGDPITWWRVHGCVREWEEPFDCWKYLGLNSLAACQGLPSEQQPWW